MLSRSPVRVIVIGLLSLPVLLFGAPLAVAHDSYGAPADGALSLLGRGWGHGRGMSQWGAFRAGQLGRTAKQITDFYYSGSTQSTFTDRTLRVLLEATNGDRLVRFQNRPGLTATVYASDQGTVLGTRVLTDHEIWRVVTDAAGLRVQWQSGSTWNNAAIGGQDAFASGALVDIKATGVLPLYDEDGGSRLYRGSYRLTRLDASRIRAINHVRMESQYLTSVVPSEVIASWPAAAIQAQAIAARSYAASFEQHPKDFDYDLCDSTSCQVYNGIDAEDARTTDAVNATRGLVRAVGDAVVRTEFSSSSGGSIAQGATGHSPPKYDPWSDGPWDPRHEWVVEVDMAVAATKIFGAGAAITALLVTERNAYGDWGGRVGSVTFTGVQGGSAITRTMTGEEVRTAFGLNSTYWTVIDSSALRWQLSDQLLTGGSSHAFTYGPWTAAAFAGDWDANGSETAGVLDVRSGEWRWRPTNTNEISTPASEFRYGSAACIPVPGDWDGDGATTPGVACESSGVWSWRLTNSRTGGPANYRFNYGPTACLPVAGDWDGNGSHTPGVVCAEEAELRWRLSNVLASSPPAADFRYGPDTALPVVGDWNSDGSTTVGITRESGERWRWQLRNANSAGPPARDFTYGLAYQEPITGDWNGDGSTTVGFVF